MLSLSTSTALITIDAQRDTLPDGPLGALGRADEVADSLIVLAAAFRDAGLPLVHVVRLYLADGSNAEPSRRELVSGTTPILRPGTPGRLLLPGMAPDHELDDQLLLCGAAQMLSAQEAVVFKPRWGAFYQSALEDHLRALGVDTLVFAGCNYPNCPRTSIYEASERDFTVVAVTDGISRLDQQGRQQLSDIGVQLATTAEVLAALDPSRLAAHA